MMNARPKKRGSTVAELCVALAVIAVVAVMAISFSAIISSRVALSKAKADAQNDIDMLESALETWMNKATKEGAVFAETKDEGELLANIDGIDYAVSFKDGILSGELTDGYAFTVHTERVSSVKFSSLVRDDKRDTIVFCKVTCDLQSGNGDQNKETSYSFCCNPHISDVIDLEGR